MLKKKKTNLSKSTKSDNHETTVSEMGKTKVFEYVHIPEPDPFEIVTTLWKGEEGDQDAGLDLRNPLLGLLLHQDHRRLRLRPPTHGRRPLPTRQP